MSKLWKIFLYIVFVLMLLALLHIKVYSQNYEFKIDSVCRAHKIAPFTTKLIIAHAKVESGNFTNNLVKKHNNLFGMKHPRVRPTLSTGGRAKAEGRWGYAQFRSPVDSVVDYLLWMEYNRVVRVYRTTDEYVTMLKKKNYFGSSHGSYYKAMRSFL